MGLARDIYRALEDIVGPENISEEPAILDSYTFQFAMEMMPIGTGERFGIRPKAVVLPETTEEVQAFVKSCNRYKTKFKAFSTGWGAWSAPGTEDVIQIDLRKMNKILEIDERNMYAVVEPYVVGAQLQAELMKRGLTCTIITAGSNCTAFTPAAITDGLGWSSVSTGAHERNILGVEWVLPTGEILRLGALGQGAGWFCGDGPGPSLRGVMRGFGSTSGGIGVFTKAATKVYHWAGPPLPMIEGVSPYYTPKSLPRKKIYCLFAPSWEKLIDAGNQIAESEIAYMLAKVPPQMLAWTFPTSNMEAAESFSKILELLNGWHGFLVVILSANSQREFDYQDKVLRQIMVETDLKSLPFVEDADIQGRLMWEFIRVSAGSRQYLRPTGGNANPLGSMEVWNQLPTSIEMGYDLHEKYMENGVIMDTRVECCWAMFRDHGHFSYGEYSISYDPAEPESVKGTVEMMGKSRRLAFEKWGVLPMARGDAAHEAQGPQLGNYHLWLRKIKKTFDPNIVADPSYYITPKE